MEQKILTPVKAIRAKCLECKTDKHGKHYNAVRDCDVEECPLHPYRFGHRPQKEE